MNETQAIEALTGLAQPDRLTTFRLLVRAGPEGLSAGDLAECLEAAPARMSFHLSALERSGLISKQRLGRKIIYSARMDVMRSLIGFLLEDCCQGAPAQCGLPEMKRPKEYV